MVSSVTSSSGSDWTTPQRLLYSGDSNADGVVSKTELATTLTSDSSAVDELVSEADSDGDSKVSLAEFSSFSDKFSTATGLSLLSTQEVSSAQSSLFSSLDSDGDGTLTSSEITDGLTPIAESSSSTTSTTASSSDSSTSSSSSDESSSDDSSDVAYTDATGTTYTKEEIAKIIGAVDENGDSRFDKSDVAAMLLDDTSSSDSDSSDTKDVTILSILQEKYKTSSTTDTSSSSES